MKILVTGATGLIGSRLLQTFLLQGHEARGLVRFSASRALPPFCTYGDVTDPGIETAIHAFAPEIVFHLAAVASNSYANVHPAETFVINAGGTVNVVEALRRMNPKPVLVLASSAEVYGGATEVVNEESPVRATIPYVASKLAAEHYVRASGLPFVIARPLNTYGRALVGHPVAVIDKAIVSALTERKIDLWDPSIVRDFLFREDHVGAYLAILQKCQGALGQTFVFGTGTGTSIGDVLNSISQKTGAPVIPIGRQRERDAPVLIGNSLKARALLGWEAKVAVEDGIVQAIQEWRKPLWGRVND